MRIHDQSTSAGTLKNSKAAGRRAVQRPQATATAVEIGHPMTPQEARKAAPRLIEQAMLYQIDRWQRSVLFLDMLRERADNMLAHEDAGMPAPLDFEYETILDARHF